MIKVRVDIMAQCFGKIGVDENDCITENFFHFPIGTHREEVWHWFEEVDKKFSIGDFINYGDGYKNSKKKG